MARKARKATRRNYSVGYSKPPLATRWRKGQSGNPKGRPRKSALTPQYQGFVNAAERRNQDDVSKCANALFRAAQQLASGNAQVAFAYLVGAAILTGQDYVDSIAYDVSTDVAAEQVRAMAQLSDSIAVEIHNSLDRRYEDRKMELERRRENFCDFKP